MKPRVVAVSSSGSSWWDSAPSGAACRACDYIAGRAAKAVVCYRAWTGITTSMFRVGPTV